MFSDMVSYAVGPLEERTTVAADESDAEPKPNDDYYLFTYLLYLLLLLLLLKFINIINTKKINMTKLKNFASTDIIWLLLFRWRID